MGRNIFYVFGIYYKFLILKITFGKVSFMFYKALKIDFWLKNAQKDWIFGFMMPYRKSIADYSY